MKGASCDRLCAEDKRDGRVEAWALCIVFLASGIQAAGRRGERDYDS